MALQTLLAQDFSTELAEQLIRLRRYRGVSQQELAESIGTKQAAISRHESGATNISVKTLEAIMKALDAVGRIDLIPAEIGYLREQTSRWWVAAFENHLASSTLFSQSVELNSIPEAEVQYNIVTTHSADLSVSLATLRGERPKSLVG